MDMRWAAIGLIIAATPCIAERCIAATNSYPWMENRVAQRCIARNLPVPKGFIRTKVIAGSFADWLRNLPLKAAGTEILLHNGQRKPNQTFHAAVLDIDTGERDLQQCADAIIRLRAEYLFSLGKFDSIVFNFTNGNPAPYERWIRGYRPQVSGNTVRWERRTKPDTSYKSFRSYQDLLFIYAGTESLSRELDGPIDVKQMQIGDVFIRGGMPGHAVIVLDMAENKATGAKVFMLAQSYMPAQDIHVLKNLKDAGLAPWYQLDFGEKLQTPEWEFLSTQLKRFKNP